MADSIRGFKGADVPFLVLDGGVGFPVPLRTLGRILILTVLGLSLSVRAASAQNPPRLDQTELYTKKARACREVDPETWTHPTRKVLAKRAVILERVQICNNNEYPVFTVRFKYDPRGRTSDYFYPLYDEMTKANGGWPFSFVDRIDGEIISVAKSKDGAINIDYETFAP